MHHTTEVLVLGGGVAGLSAARTLEKYGIESIVIEARDRLGGRVHTLRDSAWPHPMELGAEFMHGLPRKLKLPHRFALRPRDCDGEHWLATAKGLRKADDTADAAMEMLGAMKGAETTAENFLEHHAKGAQRAMARQFVTGFYAADPRTVSTRFLADETLAADDVSGDRMFRPTAGYDVLIHRLAEKISTHLSTRVTSVKWKRGRVDVEARDALGNVQTYRAKAVVLALPLGVLQDSTVKISPTPEGLKLAKAHLEMGPIVKLLLRFRETFWEGRRGGTFTMLHSASSAQQVWWKCAPHDSPVLVGWSAGPKAKQLSRTHAVGQAIQFFEKTFKVKNVGSLLEASLLVDWSADVFARGGYMVQPVGLPRALRDLFAPVDDTFFFAGEHTSYEGHAGTVHGAVWTGERAAEEIHEARR